MKMNKLLLFTGLLTAGAALTSQAAFTHIFNADQTVAGGNLNTTFDVDGTTGSGFFRALSLNHTTPTLPPTAASWPVAYGGYYAESSTETFAVTYAFRNDTDFRWQNSGDTHTLYALAYWETPGGSYSFDADFSLTMERRNGNGPLQFMVRTTTGDTYVSTTVNNNNNAVSTLNAADTTWQLWDFTLNSGNNYAVTFNSAVAVSELNGMAIDAIGIYTARTSVVNNSNVNALGFEGTAIPEPSTYAALLGLLGLGFVMYSRRKQK